MPESTSGITIRFYPASGDALAVELTCDDGSTYQGTFAPPYDAATWAAILRALEPGFDLAQADDAIRSTLRPLGDLARLQETVG